MSVPKLRFPEFCGVGEWKESPLSNFFSSLDAGVSVVSGDRPAKKGESGILKTSAVTDGIFNPLENKVVLDESELQRLKEPVCKNTIIISRMNTPALVGANAFIEESLENIFLPDRLWAAKPTLGASMRFIAFVLSSDKGRTALSELATGTSGSMKNITKPAVLALEISAPSLPEQQKIADCLSSLSDRITLETQKLDSLKAHKKGLMQQLFTAEGETLPKLRFPEFRDSGEWEEKNLGEIAALIAEKTGNRKYTLMSVNSGVGLISQIEKFGREIAGSSYKNYFVIRENDFAYNKSATKDYPEGFIAMHSSVELAAVPNSIFTCFRIQDNKICPQYLKYLFLFNLHGKWLKQFISVGARAHGSLNIDNKDLLLLPIPLPKGESSLSEQQKIADCLSSIDEAIAAQSQAIELLKLHKKGLMQQLFPTVEEVKG